MRSLKIHTKQMDSFRSGYATQKRMQNEAEQIRSYGHQIRGKFSCLMFGLFICVPVTGQII